MNFDINNNYGITKPEWKAFKKELKKLDKQDDSFKLTKADYKEMEAHIEAGDFGVYMEQKSAEIKHAMGLALNGKVDDLAEAQRIAKGVELHDADLDKVLGYIESAIGTPKNNETAIATMGAELAGERTSEVLAQMDAKTGFYATVNPDLQGAKGFRNFLNSLDAIA